MHIVLKDLKLDRLWIVFPGENRYSLGERIETLPLEDCRPVLKEAGLMF